MKGDTPPVRIEELRLQGFRAFENARLTLGDLTVLVGRNGAGKSTLVDAFEFIRDALTDGLEIALERRGGIVALMHRGGGTKRELAIAIKLQLSSRYIQNVADESGLTSAYWNPPLDIAATYGFRIQQKRGGAGFTIKREVAHLSNEGSPDHGAIFHLQTSAPDTLGLLLRAQWELLLRTLVKALRTPGKISVPFRMVFKSCWE